jgi:hypothetical protein
METLPLLWGKMRFAALKILFCGRRVKELPLNNNYWRLMNCLVIIRIYNALHYGELTMVTKSAHAAMKVLL